MLRKKPLILLAGPDGSGKTTLAIMLKKELEKQGYKVKIIWIRGTHSIAFLLSVFLKKLLKLYGNQLFYHQLYIPRKIMRFWLVVELVSILPLMIWYYHLYRLRYAIISERSLLDFAIWIVKGLGDEKLVMRSYAYRIILTLINRYRPIYIRAHITELINRKPYEKFLIQSFYPHYEALSKVFNLTTVDTTSHKVTQSFNYLKKIIGLT